MMMASHAGQTGSAHSRRKYGPLPTKSLFIEFHACKNSRERKTVRVQAAKASAAARKATIVEKSMRGRLVGLSTCEAQNSRQSGRHINIRSQITNHTLPSSQREHPKCFRSPISSTFDTAIIASDSNEANPVVANSQRQLARAVASAMSPVVGHHNPVNSFNALNNGNIPWLGWYDGLLHHIFNVCAPHAWATLHISPSRGHEIAWYMHQMAMKEPALFYANLLFHCDDLVISGLLSVQQSYWLRHKTIVAIRQALCNEPYALSEGVILAVGHIALYEYLHDTESHVATAHISAQRRMIADRGGIENLGLPPIISHLTSLSDSLVSSWEQTLQVIAQPKPNSFKAETKRLSTPFAVWVECRERIVLPGSSRGNSNEI